MGLSAQGKTASWNERKKNWFEEEAKSSVRSEAFGGCEMARLYRTGRGNQFLAKSIQKIDLYTNYGL